MAHLLEFDSLLGRLAEDVTTDAGTIVVGGRELQALSIPEPADLPWRHHELRRADGQGAPGCRSESSAAS
jgi:glyceraldehyde-3-phosphate dehydrogenase/erythrose-4-phosphate dehydrogenase